MINTCSKCGNTRTDKIIDKERSIVICPECGHEEAFKFAPLYLIGGAGGCGKTAVCKALVGKTEDIIPIDGDILWENNRFSIENPHDFYEAWLRICKNISQTGKRVALFHAGAGTPSNIIPCLENRYFSDIHYLGLYCSDEALKKRLLKRRAAGGFAPDSFIESMQNLNHFWRDYNNDEIPMDKIDTTEMTVDEAANKVLLWLKSK